MLAAGPGLGPPPSNLRSGLGGNLSPLPASSSAPSASTATGPASFLLRSIPVLVALLSLEFSLPSGARGGRGHLVSLKKWHSSHQKVEHLDFAERGAG